MEKQGFKYYFFLLGILSIVSSCLKDDHFNIEENQGSSTSQLVLKSTNPSGIKIHTIFYKSISEIPLLELVSIDVKHLYNTGIYDPKIDFYVDISIVNYIEEGTYHSYTFPVYSTSYNKPTQNLLLSLQDDGSYKAFLIAYKLTEKEKNLLQNNIFINLEDKTVITEIENSHWINTVLLKQYYAYAYNKKGIKESQIKRPNEECLIASVINVYPISDQSNTKDVTAIIIEPRGKNDHQIFNKLEGKVLCLYDKVYWF